ncbi:MAG: hypothetical protein APF84_05430 [Gracilibacter sp. BRH_c7a]|nr:MAG: hypothetical protein APF84_05430 [Gracilibacter sp. BRH_c7a]
MLRNKRVVAFIIALVAITFIVTGCSQTTVGPAVDTTKFANPDMLIEVDALTALLEDPNVVILDIRDPKKYLLGHIKGAQNVWRPDISAPKVVDIVPGRDLSGMTCDQAQWEELLGKLGISNDTQVVVYDDNGLYDSARLYWQFYGYGHENMQVLNGGFDVWKAKGGATELGTSPTVEAKTYKAKAFDTSTLATLDEVKAAIDNPDYVIIDTRELKEWTGEDLKSGAYRKGRIPSAVFINWKETLNEDETVKSKADLEKLLADAGVSKDKTIIPYCQSGVRSANLWFTLNLLGYENVKNFDGSWIEWSIYDDLPLVTGE